MPIAKVQLPDGRIGRFEVPEGTTPEQVMEFASSQKFDAPAKPKGNAIAGLYEQMNPLALAGAADEFGALLDTGTKYVGQRGAKALGYDVPQESFGQRYGQALQGRREDIAAARERLPVQSIAANITGALTTGGLGAGTGASTAIANSLRTGNLAARTGKAALTGATSGSLYGFGEGEGDASSRLGTATSNAITGAAIGGALPVLGAAAGSGLKKLAQPKQIQATADEVRQLAGQSYKAATAKGGVLKSNLIDNFVDDVQKMTPQTEMGKILGGDSKFSELATKIESFRGKEATLEAAQEIDELLSDQIDNFVDRTTGKVTKEGKKILDVQNKFRQTIDTATEADIVGGKEGFEAIKEGRRLWSKAAKLNDIERIIARAEMTDNPATGIKAGFRTLASNPARMRGYNDAERKAIEQAAKTGIKTDIARVVGSRLNPIIAGSTGGLGAAAIAQGSAMAGRSLATKGQMARANKVAATIAGDLNKISDPTMINRIAQRLLTGTKPSVSEIKKMKPVEVRTTMNLLKQTEGMNAQQIQELLNTTTK